MSKVYVVTSGEYSDYRIRAVFLSHDKAIEFSSAGGGEIEEWDADSWTRDDGGFSFDFDMAGNIKRELFQPQRGTNAPEFDRVLVRSDEVVVVIVSGGDRDRSVKIAAERYIRFRASWDEAWQRSAFVDWNSRYHIASEVANALSGIRKPLDNGSIHSEWVKRALAAQPVAV